MNNPKGTGNQGQNQTQPTDKGEDSEDRRRAAERAWKDRESVPRGTPEQGGKSADRVGGGDPSEIDNEDVEREGGRTFEDEGGRTFEDDETEKKV